jgi:WD40 repeat protein
VFEHDPYREYRGHKKEILKLAWSAGNFLLSSSMDKTVRLWHVLRADQCLATFRHGGNVTAIEFHPRDERYFLSASYQEMRLRLFNIPEKKCIEWAPTNVAPTAACFSEDGKTAVAGCSNGMCKFYSTEGLRFVHEIDAVAGNRKRAEDRKKVTGLEWATGSLLVTTNDSRIRRFDMRDFSLICKYSGFKNKDIPVYATLSEQGEYIVCGSENNCVYVWNTITPAAGGWFGGSRQDRNDSYESYAAHDAMVTATCWAPFGVRGLVAEGPEYLQGQIILSADYNGKIKIFEVRGAPLSKS